MTFPHDVGGMLFTGGQRRFRLYRYRICEPIMFGRLHLIIGSELNHHSNARKPSSVMRDNKEEVEHGTREMECNRIISGNS